MIMDEKNCIVCGAEAPKRCSGCRSVHYCSIEHQKLHWKEQHKLKCSLLPYRVDWDVDIGYHLVANKNIEPGDLILAEDPLIIVPMNKDGPSAIFCVGCNKTMKQSEAVVCPQCNWPMCGKQQCWSESSPHALGECALLKTAGDRVTVSYSGLAPKEVVYRSIWILRCLSLKEKEPAKWEKLVKMTKSFYSASSQQIGDGFKDVIKLINVWLPDAKVSKELIRKICSLFCVNKFDFYTTTFMDFCGLYSLASTMDHRCVPNATYGFKENGQIVIRAAVPITKASRIYNDYTISNGGLFCSTILRQSILEQTRFGSCSSCPRCKDPTEMGTYSSGVYCPKCPNLEGILLPENPFNENSDWLCNKCSFRLSYKSVINLTKDSMQEFLNLDLESVPDCENFIQKYAKTLHPHNFMLTGVKYSLVNKYRHSSEKNLDDAEYEMLEKKESLILELFEIANVLSPGLSNFRRALICDFFENIVDVRREAGLTDGKTVENTDGGPSRTELKLIYEKFCMDGIIYSRVK